MHKGALVLGVGRQVWVRLVKPGALLHRANMKRVDDDDSRDPWIDSESAAGQGSGGAAASFESPETN